MTPTLLTLLLLVLDVSGATAPTPEVKAAETQTAEVSQTIDQREIENMPLGDRRSMNMVGITGASVFVNYESGQKANFSLAGGRSQSQMFTLDGGNAQSMRLGGGQADFDPPVESMNEVKVVANGYSAEHGGSAGGLVAARLKSGSNSFRGSLFEFLRNDRLDAANFFAPVSGTEKLQAPLRYNVFGGTAGGPIRRNRTYFFFSYEGSRRYEGSSRSLTVPTDAQRAGDFSGTLNTQGRVVAIYDPATTRLSGSRYVRDPFPGNVIPTARFDAVAAQAAGFYPRANVASDGGTGSNNFRANSGRDFNRDHFTVKFDHNLGAKDHLSGRYTYDTNDQITTSVFPNPAAENQVDTLSHQHNASAAWTRTWNAAFLQDVRFTWSNRVVHQVSKGLGDGWPSRLGLRGVPETAFPRFAANGFTPLGANNQERRQFPVEQYQALTTFTRTHGNHALKFGFEFRPARNVEVDLPNVSGNFTFTPQATGLSGQAGTGNSLASMLLGFPNTFNLKETETLDRSSHYYAAFLQDNWTAGGRFTLNFGLRWEMDTPMTDANNRMNGFDMAAINPVSGTPGVVRFAGIDGWGHTPYGTDWNNFGPRAGFAWRPSARTNTVIRGGYGIFIAHPFDHSATSSASLGYELSARFVSPDNGITAPFYLRDGVPPIDLRESPLDAGFGAVPAGRIPTTAVGFFESNRVSGYAQQSHLAVQHTLPGAIVMEAGYIGNIAHKLSSSSISINQIRPEWMGPNASQNDRPFPQFSDVQVLLPSLGNSAYHAAALRAEKRFSRGVQFLATYTWSRLMTDADDGGQGNDKTYSNYYDRRADWGPSDNDIRHRFTWSSVYDVPLGSGHGRLEKGWLGAIAGGWAVGSVVALQSGAPFTVTTQVNTTNAFSAGPLRADVLRNPTLSGAGRTLGSWFDTAAFAQPAPYTFGNQGNYILRGDGLVNFDFSILRNFAVRERFRIQFRGELFNAFNHANFGQPGHVLGNPDFGVVSTASPARRVQVGARIVF